MDYILCALAGYLIGGISPSYLIARRKGFDIRTKGSGNAGATNTMLTVGARAGVLVMLLDVLKTVLCILAARLLFPSQPLCGVLAGIFCVLGHIFSIYLHFHGGKGTACLCGLILTLTPELVLPMLALIFLIGLLCNRASILPLLTALLYPPLYFLRTQEAAGSALLFLVFLAMLWAHRGNFAKWRTGQETPFRRFLFGRDPNRYVERENQERQEEHDGL